jgi:CRP-like cAMP-binding protein
MGDVSMIYELHKRAIIRNGILSNLAVREFARIRPYLQPVQLKEGAVLQEPKKRIQHVHFIEAGMVSLRTLATESILETALVGRYGAVGASVVLGAKVSMHQSFVLVPGSAFRIPADDLCRLVCEGSQIRETLLQYIHALMIHGSQTALCGVRHKLEQRIACWLCIACDALDGNVLPMTHNHLSAILGLRRAGLTEALIRFEEHGLIRKTRGVLEVRDRTLLQQKACCCYGVIAKSYHRPKITSAERLVTVTSHAIADEPA